MTDKTSDQVSREIRARIDALVLEARTPAEFLALMRAAEDACGYTSAHIHRVGGIPRSTAHWFTSPRNHGLPAKPEQVSAFFTGCEFTTGQLSTVMSIWHTLDQQRLAKAAADTEPATSSTVDSIQPVIHPSATPFPPRPGSRTVPERDSPPATASVISSGPPPHTDQTRRPPPTCRLSVRVWPWLLATACLTAGVWVGIHPAAGRGVATAQAAGTVVVVALIWLAARRFVDVLIVVALARGVRKAPIKPESDPKPQAAEPAPTPGGQMVGGLRDEDVKQIIDQTIVKEIAERPWGPPIGRMLVTLLADNRHLAPLDLLAERAHKWALDSQETVDELVFRDAPRWAPKFVNILLSERIYRELVEFTWKVRSNPEHDLRLAAARLLEQLADDLQHDDAMIEIAEQFKTEVMGGQVIAGSAEATFEHARHDWTDDVGQLVVSMARSMIGEQVLGSTGSPTDISGLQSADAKFVQSAFAGAGFVVPPTTFQMSHTGASVELDDMRPGDIIVARRVPGDVTEVGIYAGGDKVLCVPRTGGIVHGTRLHRAEIDKVRRMYLPRRKHGSGIVGAVGDLPRKPAMWTAFWEKHS